MERKVREKGLWESEMKKMTQKIMKSIKINVRFQGFYLPFLHGPTDTGILVQRFFSVDILGKIWIKNIKQFKPKTL